MGMLITAMEINFILQTPILFLIYFDDFVQLKELLEFRLYLTRDTLLQVRRIRS